MTDLEPSSDWRTWSITVPSPASEQSVTSSPLQTSVTLYSIFRIIATPFLKFFSIFLSFFFFVRFLPASRFFQSTLAFFSFHPFPRFAFPISTLPCVSFKRFISTPPSVSYCLYANHSQTFSSTPRLILYILHIESRTLYTLCKGDLAGPLCTPLGFFTPPRLSMYVNIQKVPESPISVWRKLFWYSIILLINSNFYFVSAGPKRGSLRGSFGLSQLRDAPPQGFS